MVIFTTRPLYSQGKISGTHFIGGWVGPRAVLDAVSKRKFPSSFRHSISGHPIVQHVVSRCIDWDIPITVRTQNCIPEEIKNRLNPGNACYHSLQYILFSIFLSKLVKILLLVLYGCETWSLILREVHRWRVFNNRMGRIFWSKREEIVGGSIRPS